MGCHGRNGDKESIGWGEYTALLGDQTRRLESAFLDSRKRFTVSKVGYKRARLRADAERKGKKDPGRFRKGPDDLDQKGEKTRKARKKSNELRESLREKISSPRKDRPDMKWRAKYEFVLPVHSTSIT